MRSPKSLTTHTAQPKIVGFSLYSIVAHNGDHIYRLGGTSV